MKQEYNALNKQNKTLGFGQLEKSGDVYEVHLLGKHDIPDILNLQQKIFNDLPEEQKSFILPKTEEFFEKHFSRGHNQMLGIYVDGKLIAQSIILNPTEEHPETGMVDMKDVDSPDKVSIIEGVLVDADYRGNHLMEKMVQYWIDYTDSIGREHVIAEIAVDNPYSWGVFLDKGLTLHSMGVDPDDGTELYNAHETVENIKDKNISGHFNYYAEKKLKTCDAQDLDQQKQLMQDGYIGTSYNRQTKKIIMAK